MSDLPLCNILQRYSSDILWHFVGRKLKGNSEECYETVLSILKEGKLRLGKQPEPFIYHKSDGTKVELIGYPVCCLADIPLKDLPLHSIRYGNFAIGFHRKNALLNHFVPVLYIPQGSPVIEHYLAIRDELETYLQATAPDKAEKFQEFLLMLGSVTKTCNFLESPTEDPLKDSLQLNNFYYEREWRSIYEWNFNCNDVAFIIVDTTEQIARLRKEMPSGALKVLDTVPILTFDMIFKI